MSDHDDKPDDTEDEELILDLDLDDAWDEEPTTQASVAQGHLSWKRAAAPPQEPPDRQGSQGPTTVIDPDLESFADDDEEDPDAETRLAALPAELMASLQELDAKDDQRTRTTKPPPQDQPDLTAAQPPPDVSGVFAPSEAAGSFDPSDFDDEPTDLVELSPDGLEDLEDAARFPQDPHRRPTLAVEAPEEHAPEPSGHGGGAMVVQDHEFEELSPVEELSGPADLSDLAPPDEGSPQPDEPRPTVVPPPAPIPDLARRPPRDDRVAAAARRTVRTRRPRHEHLPLVGQDREARLARAELLRALSAGASGAARAALLVQRGELLESCGLPLEAREAYDEARSADAHDAEPLRALARLGAREDDWASVHELLLAEAELPLPPGVRAEAALGAALVAWHQLEDPGRTESAASEALRLAPESAMAALLLLRVQSADGSDQVPRAALALADRSDDGPLAACLRVGAARHHERAGEHEHALGLFQRAAQDDPQAPDALLGVARTALALSRHGLAEAALRDFAALLPGEAVSIPAVQRARARILGHRLGLPGQATEVLESSADAVTRRARARFAQAAGDAERELQRWAEQSSGSERALAYLELAEWQNEHGQNEAAETSLARARDADGTLHLTRVVREVLARRAGDSSRLAEAMADEVRTAGAALAAAARLAPDADAVTTERSWLDKPENLEVAPASTRVLALDAAVQADDEAAVAAALDELAQATDGSAGLAARLALALKAQQRGEADDARAQLEQALQHAGSNWVRRPLALATEDAAARAALLRTEAEAATGSHAASLCVAAARLLEGEAARGALDEARAVAPDYLPARWALAAAARRAKDLPTLQSVCLDEAQQTRGPPAVAALVRAALIGADQDPDRAASMLVEAARQAPTDAVLRVLVSRVGDALPAQLRAEIYDQGTEDPTGATGRARVLTAAGAWEDAGEAERALALYTRTLAADPEDAVAEAGFTRLAASLGRVDDLLDRLGTRGEAAQSAWERRRARSEQMRLLADAGCLAEAAELADALLDDGGPDIAECLRVQERAAQATGDAERTLTVQRRMCDTSHGPRDAGARLRLMSALHRLHPPHDDAALDELLCERAGKASAGPWLARRLIAAGRARGDDHCVAQGWRLLLATCVTHSERTAVLLRLNEIEKDAGEELTDLLRGAVEAAPDQSLLAEVLGLRLEAQGEHAEAAERLEQAARTALSAERQVRLWHRSAVLWQDRAQVPDRARESLRAAAEVDVGFRDVSARLERLLDGRQDIGGLITLTEARIAAGGSPAELAALHRNLADLHEKNGNHSAAREQLRASLGLEPDDVDVLRRLAALCERDGEYRECAEAWIRVARLLRDPQALSEVFFKLGCIYDGPLPEPSRAEAAHRRVLKLSPRHAPSLRALARLYERRDNVPAAIEAHTRLAGATTDPAEQREVVLRLAELLEQAGQGSEAERTLEALRREQPTQREVLAALASLYRRQAAGSALAMHTNRAASDLRGSLRDDLTDTESWRTLVEVLGWRGRPEPGSVVATTAASLGIKHPQIDGQAADDGLLPGAGGAVLAPEVLELCAPEPLTGALRRVLFETSEVLDKVMPFDARTAAAERLPRKHPLRTQAKELARWFGKSEAELLVSSRVPTSFLAVSDASPTFVIGSQIVDSLGPLEQRFLLARAYVFSACHLSVVCRLSPDDLTLVLHALVRAFVDDHAPAGVDRAALEETSNRIQKVLPRRLRETLHDAVVEVGGAQTFDPSGLYVPCAAFASRAGLVATGAVSGALRALCRLAGSLTDEGGPFGARLVQRTLEAQDLVRFALGEAHFEARRRAGADGD